MRHGCATPGRAAAAPCRRQTRRGQVLRIRLRPAHVVFSSSPSNERSSSLASGASVGHDQRPGPTGRTSRPGSPERQAADDVEPWLGMQQADPPGVGVRGKRQHGDRRDAGVEIADACAGLERRRTGVSAPKCSRASWVRRAPGSASQTASESRPASPSCPRAVRARCGTSMRRQGALMARQQATDDRCFSPGPKRRRLAGARHLLDHFRRAAISRSCSASSIRSSSARRLAKFGPGGSALRQPSVAVVPPFPRSLAGQRQLGRDSTSLWPKGGRDR